MLKLLNTKKEKITLLRDYSDLKIESDLESGDKTLSFSYPKKSLFYDDIVEENYIRTKENEFVIKAKDLNGEFSSYICKLNVEDLEGETFDRFESIEQTITNTLNLAIVGTGWTVANNDIKKKRTIRKTNCSSWDIVQEIKKTYRVDIEFDTLNKKIKVYENLGEDKGTYFIDSLNLKALQVQSDSYNYATRIIPIGKDGLTIEAINNGKNYVENYQYSNKVKTIYWKDDRYIISENLKEDAEAKLYEISKPYRAYSASIINLAKMNDKYKNILDYKLGDTITLISKNNKVKEKQRIVKIVEYLDDHSRDTVELANTILKFEDIQKQFQDTSDIVDNITTDNGTIDGSTIDGIETDQIKDFETNVGKIVNLEAIKAEIKNLKVDKADIQDLNAVNAKIGTLQATKADITELNAVNANIDRLQANKADITELNAISGKITVLESQVGKIGVLESNVANIKDLINGNLSSENIQTGGITGDRLNMSTIFVNDANIINVNASKMNTGELNTTKVKIKSEDGGIEIVGATQQFKDKNNKVRIQMGKDTKGNFNFILRDEDGTTTLIDHNGIKEKAIADNLIKENMVAPDTIGEKSINYNSFATGFNKDTNTSTIKGTKVRLDNQNQTLEAAFTSLKNQADGTKTQTESNTTQISIQQGKISTLIADTSIVKDGQTIKLKDDYNSTVATVNSMKNTINSHTTQINANTGKITGVESKTNVLERDLNSMSSKLTSTEQTVSNHTTQINSVQSIANNANKKIDGLEIGSRNLLRESMFKNLNDSFYGVRGDVYTLAIDSSNKYEGYNSLKITGNAAGDPQGGKDVRVYTTSGAKKGKIFRFSFYAKSDKNINFFARWGYTAATEKNKVAVTTTWKKYVIDLHTENMTEFHEYFYIILDSVGTVWIAKPKLEEGNKNTDYTEAPEDIQTQIDSNKNNIVKVNTEITTTKNKVSTIEQNMDSITQRVGSVETITTSHTASLNAVDGKINTAKNEAIVDSRKMPDTRDTNQSPGWYFSNYPRQTITEFKHSDVIGIPGGRVYGTVTTAVPWTESSGGYPVQTFRSNSKPTYERKGTSSTSWGSWTQIEDTAGSQSKANQALNDSKAFTNGEISKVNTTMNSKFAEIKTTTDAINLEVNNTKKEVEKVNVKVDNLEVGIRNYLPSSDKLKVGGNASGITPSIAVDGSLQIVSTRDNGNWVSSFVRSYGNIANEFKENDDITVSLIIKSNQSKPPKFYFKSGMGYYAFDNVALTNEYQQISLTTKWKKNNPLDFHLGFAGIEGTTNILKIKVSKGDKAGDWIPAIEDTSQEILDVTTTKINDAKAEIKLTTDSIKQSVSNVESSTATLNGKITAHESRLSSAEQKITSSAIVSTVTSSTTYRNDLSGKVSTNQIISSINQTAEAVKIKANKIALEGATTVGDSENRHIKIDKANYSIWQGSKKLGYFGVVDDEKGGHPKITLGWNGIDVNKDDYLTIHAYPTQTNPENNSASYTDIAYRCIKFKDWSNMKMYGDGDIRLSPIKDLIITTNYSNGSYGGQGENRVAMFAGSASEYYNGNLQIHAVRNMTNGYGLVLTDDHASNKCAVRVNVDGSGNRFFRPLTTDGNVELGSGSYKWKKVFSNGGVAYSVSDIDTAKSITYMDDSIDNVIDTLEFDMNIFRSQANDSSDIQLNLNVANLKEHPLSNMFLNITEDYNEEIEAFERHTTADMTSLLHLALYELQKQKKEIEQLKNAQQGLVSKAKSFAAK